MFQIHNGSKQLEIRACTSNANYMSKATTTELLNSFRHCIEESHLIEV